MWFGYEEDSPTNKTRGFKGHSPFIKGAIAPSTACTRVREKYARVRVRARAYTRARGCTRAHLYLI